MTYYQSSGKHEILQKWKMKIFIVLVGKNKKRPVTGAPLRTINLLRKNWISAGELYQLCEEAPQLPDNRQNKGHLLRWPFDTSYTLSPTHEHNQQCHICGWWAKRNRKKIPVGLFLFFVLASLAMFDLMQNFFR
ncbi:hypothetical protein [Escherichia coli]|uniref:hypothetical protein n=2 Tax=Escherichia coli TaxID=562 RepID=UPI001BC85E5F